MRAWPLSHNQFITLSMKNRYVDKRLPATLIKNLPVVEMQVPYRGRFLTGMVETRPMSLPSACTAPSLELFKKRKRSWV